MSNERARADRTLASGRNEFKQARRLGTDLKAIRNQIRKCWEQSNNGRRFAVGLALSNILHGCAVSWSYRIPD
jgi:hypothetical protein